MSAELAAPRISLFLPNLEGGGAERVFLNLAQGFVRCGIQVDLVLSSAVGPLMKDIPEGVTTVDLERPHIRSVLPRLVSYLRRRRPQGLITALDRANVAALLARRLAGVPTRVAVTVHIPRTDPHVTGVSGWSRWLPRLMRVSYPWADRIVAVSDGVANNLATVTSLPRDTISVIYNPVITPQLWERARGDVEHPELFADDRPVILGVGRLHWQKNFPALIRAFAAVRQEIPARLVILGEGTARSELERLVTELGVAEDVFLPGFVANAMAYMARSTVFALSSRWEGLPTVLIEALALGLPVVSTDCVSGPREILHDGELGELIPVDDVAALEKGIRRALANARDPKTPRLDAIAPYTLEAVIPQYLDAVSVEAPRRLDQQ